MKKENKMTIKTLLKKLKKLGFENPTWEMIKGNVITGCMPHQSVKFDQQKVNPKLLMPDQLFRHRSSSAEVTMSYLRKISENIEETKMKIINQSVNQLTKLLKAKGYNGAFHIEGIHTDLFPDLLRNYCDAAIRDPMKPSFPFVASTYTKYNMDNTGYIKCSFTLDCVDKKGIQITQMDVANCGMDHKPIEAWNKTISGALDIPHKEQANKKVIPASMKKEKKKSLKY